MKTLESSIYIIIVSCCFLLYGCNKEETCPRAHIEEFSGVNIPFDGKLWTASWIDTVKNAAESSEEAITIIMRREQMLCDILYKVLYIGMSKADVVQLLGPTRRDTAYTHRFYVTEWDNKQAVFQSYPDIISNTKRSIREGNVLVYTVGYSASGTGYLILLFDANDKYIDFFRAEAM